MLCGYQPFYSKYVTNLIELIKLGKFDFNAEVWATVSKSAKNLISKLLQIDTKKRFNAVNCLKHPWFNPTGLFYKTKKFENESFKNNLIVNKRRLTRVLNQESDIFQVKENKQSFNKNCRQSLFIKQFVFEDNFEDEEI